jgi:IS1 family transposase
LDKALQALQLLLEGCSVRSAERITGVHRDTILRTLLLAGERCEKLFEDRIRGLVVEDVQADEIWTYVGCKEKNKAGKDNADRLGDAYTFVGIERNTKLILAWHLGRRTSKDTVEFTEKLHEATDGRFQLTTDGFAAYPDAVSYSLGTRTAFGQLIKVYQGIAENEVRYSPSRLRETVVKKMWGNPDEDRICTSHVERHNLSMRTHLRRLTRLTNGFSKKWENLRAMLALYFAFYNFCRIHRSLRCTPAMAAGVTQHIWDLRDLVCGY